MFTNRCFKQGDFLRSPRAREADESATRRSAIYVHIANKGGDDAPYEHQFEATKQLLDAMDCGWKEWNTFDFCPVSGRLCTIVDSYVSVFDYVPCLDRTE